MRRLSGLVLASILLGVPRALEGAAFGVRVEGAQVQVSRADPDLAAFCVALRRAIDALAHRLAAPGRPAVIVQVLGLWRAPRDGSSHPGAVAVLVENDGRSVPFLVEHDRGRSAAAAAALLRRLDAPAG